MHCILLYMIIYIIILLLFKNILFIYYIKNKQLFLKIKFKNIIF